MAKPTILINLNRCTGCWTCSMACKIGNDLSDDQWRQTVRTLGNGEGIDRPAGIWPHLRMSWMPLYHEGCTLCAPRTAQGEKPFCVNSCPNDALIYGDLSEEDNPVAPALDDLRSKGFRVFSLPTWESKRSGIVYATKDS